MGKRRKARIPKLKFSEAQDIGWHVSYRDPDTRKPRRSQLEETGRRGTSSAKGLHAGSTEGLNGLSRPSDDPTIQADLDSVERIILEAMTAEQRAEFHGRSEDERRTICQAFLANDWPAS